MAILFEIGEVKSVSSIFAGTLDISAGITPYSDGTLPSRSINLTLGETVVCYFNDGFGSCYNVTPVDDFLAGIQARLNSANPLTKASIKKSLQIASACAVKKGTQYFDGLKNGKDCPEKLEEAELMAGMVDSICGIIPEGEIVGGKQALYEFTVEFVNGIIPKVITVTIGSATYSLNSNSLTIADVAEDIGAHINSFYPQSYSYSALVSGASVVIAGSNFDADNGTSVAATITNGSYSTFATPQALAGGTPPVYQGTNAITNNQIQTILDRLCKLCSMPCTEVINF